MRGKVIFGCFCRFPMRITPAYAGKRCKPEKRQDCRQDHPRLCGEKVLLAPLTKRALGSPPPMRGKVLMAVELDFLVGITPAYAGKREPLVSIPVQPQGSPPPMRGKGFQSGESQFLIGITPAYAGKSPLFRDL